MRILLTLLVMAITFRVLAGLLSAVAVGLGFLLAACVPSLQLAHGIIAGAILATSTLYFFFRLVNAAPNYADSDEGIPYNHSVFVLPKDFLHRSQKRSKSKGKRK
jgi:hypothetical protein